MGSKKTTTTSKETAVTTPNTPGYIQAPVNDYYAGVSNFLKTPASSLVTPTNALQNSAYSQAASLGSNNSSYGTAMNSILALLNGGGASAPAAFSATQGQTGTLGAAPTSSATNATTTSAALANLGDPAAAQAAQAGKAATVGLQGYNPTTAGSQGYTASTIGNTGSLLPAGVERVAGASLLDNLEAYKNPATQALVDATLAEYDNNADIARAQMQRQAAGSGAFGGSRYGLAQGQFEADTGRNRALTDAELRATAFDRATSLSGQDADRRQNAATTNANAQNTLDLNRGQMRLQGLLADQSATNAASQFGANAANNASIFNATAANDASRFGADAYNTGAQFNANVNNQFAQADADRRQAAGLLNTQTFNDFASRRFDAANQNNQFNADAANTTSRFNADAANSMAMANADRQGQFDQTRYGAENAMSQFNAGQANDIASQIYGTNADLSKFNAGLGLDAASRYADIVGAQNADQRANLATQLGIGDSQWGYQNQGTQAELQKLIAAGGLLDPQMMAALTGQTITSNGTSTSKQSGGLLGTLGSALSVAGSAASLFSDRRLKVGIEQVGTLQDGLGVYEYSYVWGGGRQRGVMADEVERLRPWALGPRVAGFATVNYGAL